MTDTHNIITITPEYVFFNYRGKGCYRVNDYPTEDSAPTAPYYHGLTLLAPYFLPDNPDIQRAKREVEEQMSWIGQGELF